MSLLTEQEIRDIARSVKDIGENSDRSLILAAQKAVIAKIKEQGLAGEVVLDGVVGVRLHQDEDGYSPSIGTKLYRLPEGD